MPDLMLIDGNAVGFAAQAMRKLTANGTQTQAIFGTLRTIRSLLEENPNTMPIVFWDGASWRKDVCPEYKANRESDEAKRLEREAYKAQRPTIAKALNMLGVRQMWAGNLEADDMIALVRHKLIGKHHITIVSGDRDLWQLVGPRCDWYTPVRRPNGDLPKVVRLRAGEFAEVTGYEDATAYVQGKALLGDASDNLKGVTGIGEKAAPLILNHWGSVSAAIKDMRERGADAVPKHLSRYRKKLLTFAESQEEIDRFKRNIKLMALTQKAIPEPIDKKDLFGRYDEEKFQALCDHHSFLSITRQFDSWVKPFARLQPAQQEVA